MSKITRKYFFVIAMLLVLFSIYNYFIYSAESYTPSSALTSQAIEGQELWQENNCWSCHQLYGLGGYLGPDLTNVYSNIDKGPLFIKAFLNSGVSSMPKFNFSEGEKDAIIEYLRIVDETGYYPNFDASIERSGWVKIKYKDAK
ncbi:cytochrome c [Altibacter sp.]|uniref:c-type cytochrome n=1 Tax=Altibacter sp. TaxID=2024823 RepID=UPI0025C505AC|nr:cytochrome c [Altibacter sp.]